MNRAPETQLEFERLELKYLIDEQTAARLRTRVLHYCDPDKVGNGVYPITTLYLDTPTLAFHRAKLRNAPDRFKLRARVYDETSPVFLEVKRKVGDVILKKRAVVDRDKWIDAALGYGAPLSPTPRSIRILDEYAAAVARTGAEPRLLVHYFREAYASNVDRYARVTFDRHIRVQEQREWSFDSEPDGWTPIDGAFTNDGLCSPVIMELKCEARMPHWIADLIQSSELRYQSYSKYSNGLLLTQRELRCQQGPVDLNELGEM